MFFWSHEIQTSTVIQAGYADVLSVLHDPRRVFQVDETIDIDSVKLEDRSAGRWSAVEKVEIPLVNSVRIHLYHTPRPDGCDWKVEAGYGVTVLARWTLSEGEESGKVRIEEVATYTAPFLLYHWAVGRFISKRATFFASMPERVPMVIRSAVAT